MTDRCARCGHPGPDAVHEEPCAWLTVEETVQRVVLGHPVVVQVTETPCDCPAFVP